MSKKISTPFIIGLLVSLPSMTFAAGKDLSYIIMVVIGYLNQILVLLIGLAVVIFVWYVIQYFIKPNEDRTNAGQYVMYSLIGFFVILSFWGLVNILQNTFGLQNESNQPASWTSFKNIFPGGGMTPSGSTDRTTSPNGSSFRSSSPSGSTDRTVSPQGSTPTSFDGSYYDASAPVPGTGGVKYRDFDSSGKQI